MLISIVMPAYNAERHIELTIESVLEQEDVDFELVIVDDGSSDLTRDYVNQYSEQDDRVVLLRNPGKGAGSARNFGFLHASGEYVIFLDSDDLFEPSLLKTMSNVAESQRTDVVVCNYDVIGAPSFRGSELRLATLAKNSPYENNLLPVLSDLNRAPWNKLYKTSYLKMLNISFQNCAHANDAFFVCSSLVNARRLAIVDDCLVHYRRGTGRSIQDLKSDDADAILQPISSLLAAFPANDRSWRRRYMEQQALSCFCGDFFSFRSLEQKAKLWDSFRGAFDLAKEFPDTNALKPQAAKVLNEIANRDFGQHYKSHRLQYDLIKMLPIKWGKGFLASKGVKFW